MAQTVYIVTSGSYSDYAIEGVFDSEDNAQAFIQYLTEHPSISGDAPRIGKWTLNAFTDPISRGLTHFSIQFSDIHQGNADVLSGAELESDAVERSGQDSDGVTWYQTSVWAQDEAAALKITNERRVRYIVDHNL